MSQDTIVEVFLIAAIIAAGITIIMTAPDLRELSTELQNLGTEFVNFFKRKMESRRLMRYERYYVSESDADVETDLCCALLRGSTENAVKLVTKYSRKQKNEIFLFMIDKNFKDGIKFMAENGADLYYNGGFVKVSDAVADHRRKAVSKLISRRISTRFANSVDRPQSTNLTVCVLNESLEDVKRCFAARGGKPDFEAIQATHMACLQSKKDMVQFFLDSGVDVNAQDGLFISCVAAYGNDRMVQYLLQQGANPALYNHASIKRSIQYNYRRMTVDLAMAYDFNTLVAISRELDNLLVYQVVIYRLTKKKEQLA